MPIMMMTMLIYMLTPRKVKSETATGSVGAQRVRTMLTVEVSKIDFDADTCSLRIKGKNTVENQYVKVGDLHVYAFVYSRVCVCVYVCVYVCA